MRRWGLHLHLSSRAGSTLTEVDLDRLALPLVEVPTGLVPVKARQLTCDRCPVQHARTLISRWHSRLPTTQRGPWMAAYRGAFDGVTYAVALWHNPSARTLPADWLELRRMAVASDAPHCTASWFLTAMVRRVREEFPGCPKVISYQDTAVHRGTIYRAAGWVPEHVGAPRVRDRSTTRPGGRHYRWSLNGADPDASGKVRWAFNLR